MASEAYRRWLVVQRAKGLEPSEQEKQQFLKENVEQGVSETAAFANLGRTASAEAVERGEVIHAATGLAAAGGEFGGEDPGPASLSETVGGHMGLDTATGIARGGSLPAVQGAIAGQQMGKGILSSAVKGFASSIANPVAVAMIANSLVGSQVSAGIIGHNITGLYGEDVAAQVAGVLSGKATSASLQGKSMEAYINTLVAMENAPKSLVQHAKKAFKDEPVFDPKSTPEFAGNINIDNFSDPLGLVESGMLSAPDEGYGEAIGAGTASPFGGGGLGPPDLGAY